MKINATELGDGSVRIEIVTDSATARVITDLLATVRDMPVAPAFDTIEPYCVTCSTGETFTVDVYNGAPGVAATSACLDKTGVPFYKSYKKGKC